MTRGRLSAARRPPLGEKPFRLVLSASSYQKVTRDARGHPPVPPRAKSAPLAAEMYFLPLKRFILFLPEANFLNMIFCLLPILGQRVRASRVDVLCAEVEITQSGWAPEFCIALCRPAEVRSLRFTRVLSTP